MPAVLATSGKRRREEPLSHVEVWLGEYCSARGANCGLVLACSGFSPGVGLEYRAKVHALGGKGGFHHSDLHPP